MIYNPNGNENQKKVQEQEKHVISGSNYQNMIPEVGVKINDSGIIYLHEDINNQYNQYYTEDTNILHTEITNTYFNLKVLQTDFAVIKEDILVKKCTFTNESNKPHTAQSTPRRTTLYPIESFFIFVSSLTY